MTGPTSNSTGSVQAVIDRIELAQHIGMHLASTTAIDPVTAGKVAVEIVDMLPCAEQLPAVPSTPRDAMAQGAWPMSSDDLAKLKADAQEKAANGTNWSMDVGCMFVLAMIERIEAGADQQPAGAVVYPADGTVSPFTAINLGSGMVKMGDSVHDGRLPALWFGKDGLGMGVEETMNRKAEEGETLAVVTFGNVEALDVLIEVVQRIHRIAFPKAPGQQPAGYIDRKDVSRLTNCRATIWPGTNEIDAVPLFRGPPDDMLQEFLSIIHDRDLAVGDRFQRVASRIGVYCKVRELQEDPLDIVRTLLCTVDHYWSLPDDKREAYPSPTSELSPLMQAARRACVERGFTACGLAIDPSTEGTPP